jgi:hypothetical protein
MPNLDVTVQKKFTLNTGNYSSIQPSVSITVHNVVDTVDLPKVHKLLDIITDAMLHKQIESDAKTMATVKKLGFSDYFKKVREQGNMDEVLKKAIEKLSELPPF